MAQKVPPRRSRKKTFPLLPEQDAPPDLSRDEIIRLGFPELTRCDHCGVLDATTQRYDQANGRDKHWLHPGCLESFKPTASTPVRRVSGQHVVYAADEEPKGTVVGALVKIDGMFEAWRYYGRKEPIAREVTAQAAFDAFSKSAAPPVPGQFGTIRSLIRSPNSKAVDSVRWCGGLTKCACYADGEITAHQFRWEYPEYGTRRVKVRY